MATDLKDAIRQMIEEKNYTHDMVIETIKEFVKAAYKRRYGTDSNVEISFSDDDELTVCARKTVVDEDNYYNEVTEIPLDEAQELVEDVEIGDEVLIPLDLHTFDRGSVQSAKQRAQQSFKEVQNNRTYKEFKAKEGEIILCYVNSILPNGDIRLNVGGGVEGTLPYKNQSPRESYEMGSEVKCYLERVEEADSMKAPQLQNQKGRRQKDVRIVLSRTSPKRVEKLLFIQVPEIYDHEVEIVKIVRNAGIRTKVAVRANSRDIDPVGATVGLKGNRIQSVITEIEGEKIDVVPYDDNPINFIASALTPAHVEKVYLVDMLTKKAIAIVGQKDVGLAIGPKGSNVTLANSLCDWMIEVMTQEQFDALDLAQETRERAEAIFANPQEAVMRPAEEHAEVTKEELGVGEDETLLSELNISKQLVEKLNFHDVYTAEEYFNLTPEELAEIGLSDEEKASIDDCIDVEEETEEEFECPNCGATVKIGTTVCPNCGVEFEFEE